MYFWNKLLTYLLTYLLTKPDLENLSLHSSLALSWRSSMPNSKIFTKQILNK